MISIVDYGMGNLRSVQKAFEYLGHEARICTTGDELADAHKLILPGVGAFRDAMHELRQRQMIDPILAHVESGRPFLGICLGLQLLFDVGYEDGEWKGLGIIPGKVVRFDEKPDLKIPHMGWNRLHRTPAARLLDGISEDAHFYFVHSFYVAPDDDQVIAARTDHGTSFVSMIAWNNVVATQFHPEKSQQVGLRLLSNFAAI